MTEYERVFTDLNDAQRKAVEAIEGPVLVVAGPGTGKTQLLSARVAQILQATDTDAASILCLTFTNKAATNMRDRLQKLIGADGRDVVVRTFHSFAAEIMNSYPDYFWNGARLQVAPDAIQLEIIEKILTELPLSNPLAFKFAGQFTAVGDVQQALKLTKEAGLTPDKLRAIINLNMDYITEIEPQIVEILGATLGIKKLPGLLEQIVALPDQGLNEQLSPLVSLKSVLYDSLVFAVQQDEVLGKTTNTGKWKKRWLQSVAGSKGMHDERRRNDWWLNIADVYENYRTTLHSGGYYDYADMLVEVITQLELSADLRASVQERFLYVLIDEFQDTNAAQLRLSQLVADHHAANDAPNIMAVGDDDQSIYKFNGAELNNMLEFRRMYPTAQLIVLTENYRSSQAVLDTAKNVIELAHDRLVKRETDLTKDLIAKREPPKASHIVHRNYASREHQFSSLARELQMQLAANEDSIAVLARGHESLRELAGVLTTLGVPVVYEQNNDILVHPTVQLVLRLATAVVAIQAGNQKQVNYELAQVLRHPMWGIAPDVLWHLAAQNFGRKQWLESLHNSTDDKIVAIGQWLLWLATEADYQPMGVMLEYLLGLRAGEHLTSPFREYFLGGEVSGEYVQALSAIKLLRGLAADFSRDGQSQLVDLLELTTVMRHNNKKITDSSPYVTQGRAVELLTTYKSKGLEFDQVYIIDAIEKNWQPKSGGRKPPANLPLQPNGDDEDDYIRLLYVAVTRAKRDVVVTSYRADAAGNEVLPTPLVRASFANEEIIAVGDEATVIAVLEESLRWPRLPQQDEMTILRAKLENYCLSATHLLNFLDVSSGGPETFLERNLLSLPEAQTANVAFGTAVHAALETGQKLTNLSKFSLDAVVNDFERVLLDQQLPREEFERYLLHGQDTLARLFNDLGYTLPVGSVPEQKIEELRLGEARLDGKLDRIDTSDDVLTVVDYKTGKPLTNFYTRDRTKQIKVWRYKTQLSFYAVLLANDARFRRYKTINTKLVFPEAETTADLETSFAPSAEEIDRTSRLCQIVYERVISLNLPDVSNYSQDIAGIRLFEQDLLDGKV